MLGRNTALLLGIGFSAVCMAVVLLVTFFATRSEPFLLTWVISTIAAIAAAFGFAAYTTGVSPGVGAITFGSLTASTGIALVAAVQYRTGRLHLAILGPVILAGVVAVTTLMLVGLNGLAIILTDGMNGVFLAGAAYNYFAARIEAPRTLRAMAGLYLAKATVFSLSCAVLVYEGEVVLLAAPENWSETLGRTVTVFALIGIGALSVALNHWRMARRQEEEALTDKGTGFLNRRALFELYERHAPLPRSAFIVFSLDDLKALTDQNGAHAEELIVGRFVATLARESGGSDLLARLGRDEFALVVMRSSMDAAEEIARRVSIAFSEDPIEIGGEVVHCRVTAGVAFSGEAGGSFEGVMQTARTALAEARRDIRRRVVTMRLAMA